METCEICIAKHNSFFSFFFLCWQTPFLRAHMHKSLAWPRRNAAWTDHYSFLFVFHFFGSEVPLSRSSIEYKTPLNASVLCISVTALTVTDSWLIRDQDWQRESQTITDCSSSLRDAVDGERQTVLNHIYLTCFVWKGIGTEERKTSVGLYFAAPDGVETRKMPTKRHSDRLLRSLIRVDRLLNGSKDSVRHRASPNSLYSVTTQTPSASPDAAQVHC